MTQPVVAAFDFDETLIRVDTLPDFVWHNSTVLQFVMRAFRLTPTLVLFAVHAISNQRAKESMLTAFFAGMPEPAFAGACQSYAARLDTLANPEALARVAWHRARGDEVVIVSASPEDWIRPWATAHGITQVIATKLVRQDGKLTGKLNGRDATAHEKLVRFLQAYPRRNSYELYMYGDGKSDAAMFEAADHVFKQRFA